MSTLTAADLKRAAAAKALEFVQDGAKLGLGSGTTAEAFVALLGEKVREGFRVLCVATSERTAGIARAQRIPLAPLDDVGILDLTIDGADECDHELDLIKGGGGALLKEKIVAASSKRMIVIADASKLVKRLGAYPLPVEVVGFGHKTTASRIRNVLAAFRYADPVPKLRMRDGVPYETDCGNLIYDCALGAVADKTVLAVALGSVPGVVEHGLFVGMASTLLIAHTDRIERLDRKR